jgi:hypothetical protein
VAFAGHLADERGKPSAGESSVYLIPIDDDRPAERVASGHFACWDARVR